MRKAAARGRGIGRGLPAGNDGGGGGSEGSGKSKRGPDAGGVEPASSSGYTRPRRLPFLGVGKPLLKPEIQEKVLAYIADSAGSSIASSSEPLTHKSTESSLEALGHETQVSLCPLPQTRLKDDAGHTNTDDYSMELFSHTMAGLSGEMVNDPAQQESDMECTDAQPLIDESAGTFTQSTTLSEQCTEPDSDPDETQVPLAAYYTTIHGDTDEGAHDIAEEVMDDPYVDPDWHPLGEKGAAANSSDEEGEHPQQTSTAQKKLGGRLGRLQKNDPKCKRVAGQLVQTGKIAQRAKPLNVFQSRKSGVWHFFEQNPHDPAKVICKKCSKTFSRGKNLKNLNTSCMLRHLTSMHLQAWTLYQTSSTTCETDHREGSQQRYIVSPTVSPPVITGAKVEVSLQGQSSRGIPILYQRKTDSRPSETTPTPSPSSTLSQSALSTTSSTTCSSQVQLTLPETMSRSRKYSVSHPRTLGLNGHIAKLISLEMMPYRLVESAAFRELMAYAVPRYDLPSRHFFSRKAIPALHQHVKHRIVHALKQSVSGKVHLTTDAWSSRHGQGRYVSITAHWVNVVDAGSTGDSGGGGTVLPSPRYRRQLAVGVPPSSSSSSSSSRSESLSTELSRTSTTSAAASVAHKVSPYRAASGQRQQAVLQMMCLGDRHTAEVLADYFQRQTESWLGSIHLEAGKVVSDNGRNFVAAIALSKLKHIPCLAHTLNLVVQCFLNNYPELTPLLQKVRRLCAHIRRSPVHSTRMQKLQRLLHLPNHRLIIDVATRWNSTLHMVERLCEQRQVIMHLWEDTRPGTLKADMELTGVQWSKLKDLCKVLHCFEECTRLVSADDAILSMSIPLMRLLMQTLTHLKEQASAAEVDEEEEEEGILHDIQPLSAQGPLVDEGEEEEEEEEEDDGNDYFGEEDASRGASENVGVSRSGTGFVRDWRDVDLPQSAPPPSTRSASLIPGTLAHMSDYALQIVKRDPRIAKMMNDDDYWLASILDPRYKGKLKNIMPQENLDLILANKQAALVNRLLESFPAHTSGDGSDTRRTGRGQLSRGVRGAQCRSGVGNRGFMTMLWSDFSSTAHTTVNTASMESDRRQQLSTMVTNYFSSHIDVLPHKSFPFDYWAAKLDTWPELAQYALQELACPAASVLSERVFSAAGSILTEKRTRLSSQNVDDLTFIKMNHAWVSKEFVPPSPDDS